MSTEAKLAGAGEGEIFPFPPDLAVEIYSPSNPKRPGYFPGRVRDYLDAETPLLWVIYPDAGYAMMHRPDGSARMIREMGSLDGEECSQGSPSRWASCSAECLDGNDIGVTGPRRPASLRLNAAQNNARMYPPSTATD